MSAASNSNSPTAGRSGCHKSTGKSSGTPSTRQCQGRRITSSSPPATPASAHHSGTAAWLMVAMGQAASTCNKLINTPVSQADTLHKGGMSTPSKASGVTRSVTQGIASALASKPTTENWLNNSKLMGVSARVMTHCSRNMPTNRPVALRHQGRCNAASSRACAAPSDASGLAANKMPTATNDNQKPACNKAQGSKATTTAMASNQTCGQAHWRPL